MNVHIHSKGITGSRTITKDEDASALFGCVLEVDGHVIDNMTGLEVKAGNEFTTVHVVLVPGHIEYVVHSEDTWKELLDKADQQRDTYRAIRKGDGTAIAIVT